MIRLSLLALFVFGLAVYAWRDWYRSLCGLILLMAVVEHPDMPKTMLGIQGLNPWNLLLVVIVLAWLFQRSNEGQKWDLPRGTTILLVLYLGMLLVSTIRLFIDPSGLEAQTLGQQVGEYFINTFKWVIPGLLLFVGCRSRERFIGATVALLAVYFLLGIQVIRWMPLSAATSGSDLSERALKILSNEVGYHRVNLSMMLSGASWAVLATRPLFKRAFWPLVLFLVLSFAQALTGGRAGYVTWAAVGFVLCTIRWRKYLLLAPVAVLLVMILVPGSAQRMMQGFTSDSRDGNPLVRAEQAQEGLEAAPDDSPDDYTITAGRTFAWRFVVEKIKESPVVGYGRQAMVRTGLYDYLWKTFRESFPHPHNAYLEVLLDNGVVGFVLVVPFYLVVLTRAISLFRDRRCDDFLIAGGVSAALVLALLVASMASQTFYPREGAVGMWCAMGLMWRVWVQRAALGQEARDATDLWGTRAEASAAVPFGVER